MKILSIYFVLIFHNIINVLNCEPVFDGENVCKEIVTIKREKLVEEPIKYDIKYQSMCGILPCTKTRTEIRMNSKIKTTFEDVEKIICCSGYAETPDRKCAPICLKSCQNGHCIRPGLCKCNIEPSESNPGFVGPTCNRFVCLADNRWGSKCDKECNCPISTSYCNASNGKCLCRTGWHGVNCTEECNLSIMNCEDTVLPAIIEPEVNVIDDNVIIDSSMQKLISSQQRSMLRDFDETNNTGDENQATKSVISLIAAHMGVNLFLLLLTCILALTIFWYRKRLNQIKDELYHGPYSSSSSSSSNGGDGISSNYSNTVSSRMRNRPRMPTPLENEFLSKNLNFASATRNILSKDQISIDSLEKQKDGRDKYILDPKVENHLIESQKNSGQNIYTDVILNKSSVEKQSNNTDHQQKNMSNLRISNFANNMNKLDLISEENEYQVPKSSTMRSVELNITLPDTNLISPLLANNNSYEDGVSKEAESFYEEIKPTSQK